MMVFICTLQYGTLSFKQTYMKDDASKEFLANRLSIIFVISNLCVLTISLLFGVYIDRLKLWKLVLVMHLIMLTCLIIFASKVPSEDHIFTEDNQEPFGMTFGYLLLNISATATFPVDKTLLSKAIEHCTLSRGVFMGA